MSIDEIRTGATYTCQVGRNTIRVKVTGTAANGGWQVETHTGRSMTIRNPGRFLARADATEATETPATRVDAGQAELSPTHAPEGDTGAQGVTTSQAGGTMSLLDAAAHLLGLTNEAARCNDLVEKAREQGLWTPKRGGKTPDRTLYAAILREINTRGDASRFRKTERGRFTLNR